MAILKFDDLIRFDVKVLTGPYGIIAVVLGASLLWFASGSFKHPPLIAPIAPQAPLFKVETRLSKSTTQFKEVISRGSIVANKSIPLYAQTSGEVVQIVAPKGSTVKKNDILIALRDTDLTRKLEEAKTRLAQREIEYKAFEQLEHRSFSSKITLAQNKTNLDAALSALATAKHNMETLLIRAPFDGIFNSTDTEQGSFVGSALMLGSPIGTMIDLSVIKVALQIPEKDISLVKIGGQVNLVSPFRENTSVQGKIIYISRSADPKLRTYRVEISADNKDLAFYEGMTIEAKIPVEQVDAHLVNFSTLTLDESGNVGVKTVNADSKVEFIKVTPLKTDNGKLWVTGLAQSAHIISLGQDFVVTGQKVDVVNKE